MEKEQIPDEIENLILAIVAIDDPDGAPVIAALLIALEEALEWAEDEEAEILTLREAKRRFPHVWSDVFQAIPECRYPMHLLACVMPGLSLIDGGKNG